MILAIDPGNIESAYVLLDKNLKPIKIGKVKNHVLLDDLTMDRFYEDAFIEHFAIEMISSYGMPVGREIFDTCVWIGRFIERANFRNIKQLYRKEVKMNLCNTMRANDSNIIQALVDRFAPNVRNKGKGIKANKGWFYGFKADIWAAYAVAVTYHDLYLSKERDS